MPKKVIHDDVSLRYLSLRKLPEILRDLTIIGKFNCSENYLLTLENSPLEVTGIYVCNYNTLKSLKGCTQSVGAFGCSETDITTLEGGPQYVKDFYNVNENKLISLKGAPKRVEGYFECGNNNLTSLIGAPEYVGGNFSCNYNKLTSLEGCPKYVGGDFFCRNNAVQFTTQQIRAVCKIKGDIINKDISHRPVVW